MYKIVSKYIKDLSFEIAGAKTYFLLQKNIKDFLVNFDIQSKKINENVIEIDVFRSWGYSMPQSEVAAVTRPC